eukprot:g43651.t1
MFDQEVSTKGSNYFFHLDQTFIRSLRNFWKDKILDKTAPNPSTSNSLINSSLFPACQKRFSLLKAVREHVASSVSMVVTGHPCTTEQCQARGPTATHRPGNGRDT